MARGKPLILSRKPGSTVRAERKRKSESAFQAGSLPTSPPAELRDAPAGRAAWRSLIRAHSQLPGELYNGLDRGILVSYCLAVQARSEAAALERDLTGRYQAGAVELRDLLAARVELRMSTRLLIDMQKQLYLSPKSRGGVTPPEREASAEEIIDREMDEVARLLGES